MYLLKRRYCMTERGLKIREAFRKKYGVDHPSQLPSVKEKIRLKRRNGAYDNVREKTKQTLLKKYGNENYVNIQKTMETKRLKYGDPAYNNREKMKTTMLDKYGMMVSPNTLNSTTIRSQSGELGFRSDEFKNYLISNGVSNASQLVKVKEKKRKTRRDQMIELLFHGNRLKSHVIPLFSPEEYKDTSYDSLYKFKCCKCHNEFEDTLYSGNIPRCLICYPHNKFQSSIESEICDVLLSHNVNFKKHDRTILDGNEIDILLPEKKIGIECNGIIWHSESFGKKNKNYHIDKTNLAETKGIKLIHILDWEWINKKNIVQSMLLNMLEISSKIYARKCNIIIPTFEGKKKFLIDNHIQGNDNSLLYFGLEYNGNLVSLMTFHKSRYDKNYQYEILRYCNKIGISVIGGASKLLSCFIKKMAPDSIVSYCDRRFFTGSVYIKCGMQQLKNSPPNYTYFHVNNGIPLNRIGFQKHKLHKILKTFDPSLSEWENMQINGYDRIWDCGHYKFGWNKL